MKKTTLKKRMIKIVLCVICILTLQSLPVFFKKPLNSKVLSSDRITMHYQEGDEVGAREVFALLDKETQNIHSQMKATQKDKIKVYIYTSQFSLSLREAGFITLLFAPSWYIGDSHSGDILLVSPNTRVKGHTHESILKASLHELVHSIVFQQNPKLSYFWDNGLATYLAKQWPSQNELMSYEIPSMEDMKTEDGLKFGNMGGYAFSYNYIEFLDKQYGWDKVMTYAKGEGSYEQIFQKSETEIYLEWSNNIGK